QSEAFCRAGLPADYRGRWCVNLQVTGLVRMSRSVRRVLSPDAVARGREAAIHLDVPLPARSSDLPARSGGPPSNACCLVLLQVGFTEPHRSPGTLVVSYTTVSPLPELSFRRAPAVCSLWHCPAGHPGWVLPTTLPCGARTFLGAASCPAATRPPDRLIRRRSVAAHD